MSRFLRLREEQSPARTSRGEPEPNPLWALAVGMVYLFRTGPGAQLRRDLEEAVRRYARDPSALWRLVQRGGDVVDTTATRVDEASLPDGAHKTLPEK